MAEKKKNKQFIDTCALLFLLTCVAAVLTWIVPAGQYQYEEVDGINRVIAGSYAIIDSNPQGPWDVINATVNGFINAAKTMIMIIFVGAAVYVLQKTRSIEVTFSKLVGNSQKSNDTLIVFCIMLFMSIGGAANVFANSTVALIPIGILLTTTIGLDKASGFMMVYLGAYSGFNVGWANSSTIGIAQPIAELPIFSGMNVRVVLHIINFIITFAFVLAYFKMIRKDPTRSLNYSEGMALEEYMGPSVIAGANAEAVPEMSTKHAINMIATVGAVGIIVFGSIQYTWGMDKLASVFLILAIFLGVYNGHGINGTAKLFLDGSKTMVPAAFAVGFATAISIILSSGLILNTIVYAISIPMSMCGSVIGASVMFLGNIFINFFIPSGSGQATAVMPIMVPVADLAGITRQVAVQAFQFGDGLSNCIIPTSSVLMGCLGIASVGWNRYAKWFAPLILVQIVFACTALTILQTIGWTGL